MFPVMLELSGRLAVVIGAGAVGRRKIRALRTAGVRVRAICLEPRPAGDADPDLEWRCESYVPAHLEGAALVFATGPAPLNAEVVADAHARGLLVNSASAPDQGDFHLPAVVRRGDLVVAVGTGGAAPALAAALCDWLEEELDETFADWVALLGELRPVIQAGVADAQRRAELFSRLAAWTWLERLRSEGKEAVRREMELLVRATLAEG
jgi:precorrin-2 dehydrogenase/sirohydrochlorin ferrochelatase